MVEVGIVVVVVGQIVVAVVVVGQQTVAVVVLEQTVVVVAVGRVVVVAIEPIVGHGGWPKFGHHVAVVGGGRARPIVG